MLMKMVISFMMTAPFLLLILAFYLASLRFRRRLWSLKGRLFRGTRRLLRNRRLLRILLLLLFRP
ncbi:MAG: hypothetical protein [Inoviridae sp.]|nr:MAG: hypothetical protein [Inoviridae sp.]